MIEQPAIFIAASKKFYDEIEGIKKILEYNNINASTHDKPDDNLNSEQERASVLRAYRLIKNCDTVYVYAKDGIIEDLGLDELTYAYACNKDMIFSEKITNNFINKISNRKMNLDQLINYVLK